MIDRTDMRYWKTALWIWKEERSTQHTVWNFFLLERSMQICSLRNEMTVDANSAAINYHISTAFEIIARKYMYSSFVVIYLHSVQRSHLSFRAKLHLQYSSSREFMVMKSHLVANTNERKCVIEYLGKFLNKKREIVCSRTLNGVYHYMKCVPYAVWWQQCRWWNAQCVVLNCRLAHASVCVCITKNCQGNWERR